MWHCCVGVVCVLSFMVSIMLSAFDDLDVKVFKVIYLLIFFLVLWNLVCNER